MQDPRIQVEEIKERMIFDSTSKAVSCGWEITSGSSIDENDGLNLSALKKVVLDTFWENGGSLRLRVRPNDSDSTFRRFFFMGVDDNFKMQLGVRGSDGATILELRNGSGSNYYAAGQTLTVGAWNEIVFVWSPSVPRLTSYLNGTNAVSDTVAGAATWGAYDTDYGKLKVGAIGGGSAVTDMDTVQIDLSRRQYSAGEVQDLFDEVTFLEANDSRAILSIPLRTNYNSGGVQVTDNISSSGGTITVGDGTTSSTFPTQLTPKGMRFDGSNDYLEAGTAIVPATGAFSIVALAKVTNLSITRAICGQYYDVIGERLAFGINSTNVFGQIGGTALNYAHGNTIVGRTVQYVYQRDTSNNVKLWVNGINVASSTNATNVDQQALMIGRYIQDATDAPFIGDIYTFRVYNNTLTSTQINWLYRRDLNLINI